MLCYISIFSCRVCVCQPRVNQEPLKNSLKRTPKIIAFGAKALIVLAIESFFIEALNKRYGKEDDQMEMEDPVLDLDRKTSIGEIEETYL